MRERFAKAKLLYVTVVLAKNCVFVRRNLDQPTYSIIHLGSVLLPVTSVNN